MSTLHDTPKIERLFLSRNSMEKGDPVYTKPTVHKSKLKHIQEAYNHQGFPQYRNYNTNKLNDGMNFYFNSLPINNKQMNKDPSVHANAIYNEASYNRFNRDMSKFNQPTNVIH